jgi:hypothetical protein
VTVGPFPRPLSGLPSHRTRLRPVAALGAALGVAALGMGAVAVDLSRASRSREEAERLVRLLGLTDLALVTEARYLRHVSLADLHSAFQDHPLALEHFPAGALIGPPAHLRAFPAPSPPPVDHARDD